MSEWTTLAAQVFQHRYDMTAWTWSAKPEDTYRAGAIMEARLAMVLYPGWKASYEVKNGWFGENPGVGVPLNTGAKSPRLLPCMSFRTIPDSLGARELDVSNNDDYVNTQKWFRKDWDLSDLTGAGMSSQYAGYLENARSVWYQILSRISWIPNTYAVSVDRAISMGVIPNMINTSIWQQNWGPLPSWLQNPYRQAAWNEMRGVLAELNQQVSASNMLALNQRALQLQSSREFWDKVAEYSGVDAIGNAWAKLTGGVKAFNKNVAVAKDSVTRSKALIAQNPTYFSSDQVATLDHLEGKIQEDINGIKSNIPGSILNALSQDGQALGIAPVVLISIGLGAVAAVTTVVITWVAVSEETARQAMEHEQALIMQAEKAANDAYIAEQEFILQRENELTAQKDAGQISPTEYETQMAQLRNRAEAAGIELSRRRQQTQDLAKAHSDNLNTLRASQVTGGLMQMKGMLMWGVLGVGLIIAGPTLVRRFSK